jgi:hypothetical protein
VSASPSNAPPVGWPSAHKESKVRMLDFSQLDELQQLEREEKQKKEQGKPQLIPVDSFYRAFHASTL